MAINKHNLSRNIPADVKRAVRQKCGFGCIVCGASIYEYEHVDPEFHEATTHDPMKIVLLCMQCHGKVTRKIWTKEKVIMHRMLPFSITKGNSNEKQYFDFGLNQPAIQFAGTILENCIIPILVHGEALFQITPPEVPGTPFRLSGKFYNSQGNESLNIVDNELVVFTDNWDVEITGPNIIIREAKGKVHLKLVAHAPHGIIVEKLNMIHKGIEFLGDKDTLQINYADGRKRSMGRGLITGFPIALSIAPPDNFNNMGMAAGIIM